MAGATHLGLGSTLHPLVRSGKPNDGKLCKKGKQILDNARERKVDAIGANHEKFRVADAVMAALQACAKQKDLYKGSRIHADILKLGLLEKNISVGTHLVNMYAKCGALAKAQKVLAELPVRNVVTWTALIAGYNEQWHCEEALKCFAQMQLEGISPNEVTFVCILKACGSIGALEKGKGIHAEIVRKRLLEKNILVAGALLDMYAKCGALATAQGLFDEIPFRNAVLWTALIAGYAQHGHGKEALNLSERMQHDGFSPDPLTYVCILKACGSIGAADKGKDIHAEIVREGLLGKNVLVGNALVDMYARCGVLAKAEEVFCELPIRNVISWTALITGYTLHGYGEEALHCFEQMQQDGISPDSLTFVSMLKACGSLGAADKGKDIHTEIDKEGLLEKNIPVGNALVDMYAKCGVLVKAQEVFDALPVRSAISWNTLMVGYAQFGKDDIVFDLFNKMLRERIKPNAVILTTVLNACGHSGLVNEGQMYFETMSTGYGITPALEHYTCLVDLYGRAGLLNMAVAVIKNMPSFFYRPVWNALLGACQKSGDVKLGTLAFEHAVRLDKNDAGPYICLSNIYMAAGMQADAHKIEAMRVKRTLEETRTFLVN